MTNSSKGGRLAAIERTVALVADLVAGVTFTAAEAGDRLGIGAQAGGRQLRAIERRLPGVTRDCEGRAHVWRYVQPAETLGYDKVVAACFGSSLAPAFEGTSYQSGFNAVRGWLIARSSHRRHFAKNIDRKFVVLLQGRDVGVEAPEPQEPPLDDVLEALLKERKVKLEYENFGGEQQSMVVEPLSLVLHQNRLYLVVRQTDGRLRTLKFARIHSADVRGCFTYPSESAYSPRGTFRDSYGVFLATTPPTTVRFKLTPRWRSFVKTHLWHITQQSEEVADGVIVSMRVATCPELTDFLLGLGHECEVLEPSKLRSEVSASVMKLAERYGGPASTG